MGQIASKAGAIFVLIDTGFLNATRQGTKPVRMTRKPAFLTVLLFISNFISILIDSAGSQASMIVGPVTGSAKDQEQVVWLLGLLKRGQRF